MRSLIPPLVVIFVFLVLWPLKVFDMYPWLDNIMHFGGGVALGLTFSAWFGKREYAWVLLFTFITALGWEGFELWIDPFVSDVMQSGIPDTVKDVILALFGSTLVLIWRRFQEK